MFARSRSLKAFVDIVAFSVSGFDIGFEPAIADAAVRSEGVDALTILAEVWQRPALVDVLALGTESGLHAEVVKQARATARAELAII